MTGVGLWLTKNSTFLDRTKGVINGMFMKAAMETV